MRASWFVVGTLWFFMAGGGGGAAAQPVEPVDFDKVRADIRELLARPENRFAAPGLLRLAFHSAGTWDPVNKPHGGSCGAGMRFPPQSEYFGNRGLAGPRDLLEGIKAAHPGITYSDLWILAGYAAIDHMEGPSLVFKSGRRDFDRDSFTPIPDGRLPAWNVTAGGLKGAFRRMGLNNRELVALLGAHSVGGMRPQNTGFPRAPWDNTPGTFDNLYFRFLFDLEWNATVEGNCGGVPCLFFRTNRTVTRGIMLVVDLHLRDDPELAVFARKYAEDQALWFKDFSAAFSKLSEKGCLQTPPGCPPKGWTHIGGPKDKLCRYGSYKCKYGWEKWSDKKCGCGCKPSSKPPPPPPVCKKDDVRVCPDGSKVKLDKKKCEYPKCRKCHPLKKGWTLVEKDAKKCAKLWYTCPRNTRKWSDDDCGCGCKPHDCRSGVRKCPDGSEVERDPEKGCSFPKCDCPPKGWKLVAGPRKCKGHDYKCEHGWEKWSDSRCGCGCKPGGGNGGGAPCKKGVKVCPDGSEVVRDPKKKCKFPKCRCKYDGYKDYGTGGKCEASKYKCGDGYEYWAHDDCGCGCRPVPRPRPCKKDDVRVCPDGSKVKLDRKKCEYPKCRKCPPLKKGWTLVEKDAKKCAKERYTCPRNHVKWSDDDCGCGCKPRGCRSGVRKCPDGSEVERDPEKGCSFPKCDCPPKGWKRVAGPKKCKGHDYKCEYGWEKWSDSRCGCGCKPGNGNGGSCKKDDVKVCPDGSKVKLDKKKCEYPKCKCYPLKKGWTVVEKDARKCTKLWYTCPRNTGKWSDDHCGCGCKPHDCRSGVRKCPDGSKVERDPEKGCSFPKCDCPPKGWKLVAGPRKCKGNNYKCEYGWEKWSDSRCGCGCKPGPPRRR